MPVTCESRYIGSEYPGARCMAVVDGDSPCVEFCRAARSEAIIDEILDDARRPDGSVDVERLLFMGGAASEILQMTEPEQTGGNDG